MFLIDLLGMVSRKQYSLKKKFTQLIKDYVIMKIHQL